MWDLACIAWALDFIGAITVLFDFCAHGTPWRKRAKVAGWNVGMLHSLSRRCSGKGCLCSRTGKLYLGRITVGSVEKASKKFSFNSAGLVEAKVDASGSSAAEHDINSL